VTCASVGAAVVDASAGPRLENPLGDVDLEEVALGAEPGSDAFREELEGALDRRLDDDRLADGRGGGRRGHGRSSVGSSTATS
jgi:hypothetical protein